MAAVWILLGKTRFPSTLLQGSPRGIEEADVPFAIEAELVDPALASGELHASSSSVFDSIIHESRAMRDVVALAARAAPLDVPVLIEGESGTGKELLARALHSASRRAKAPFIGINCGALPSGTVESELFGHERGAFTGAVRQRKGYFEEASGGTLFLDEVSELPLHVQVKLLRVLQEGEVTRLGLSRSLKVDVRIVAATNQSLIAGVQAGSFRQDLLYRLAWVVLNVPPLRDRGSDVDLLIKHALVRINEKAGPTTFQRKILSAGGRKRLNEHPWPGNVRELVNTLWRAVFWSSGSMITEKDVDAAFLRGVEVPGDGVLNRPIGSGLDLKAILKDVESHYMKRAMDAAPGNKAEAARLLGIKERKTFAYRAKKYGL
jgi:DNA-binding NtrC family response regulator